MLSPVNSFFNFDLILCHLWWNGGLNDWMIKGLVGWLDVCFDCITNNKECFVVVFFCAIKCNLNTPHSIWKVSLCRVSSVKWGSACDARSAIITDSFFVFNARKKCENCDTLIVPTVSFVFLWFWEGFDCWFFVCVFALFYYFGVWSFYILFDANKYSM